MDTSRPGWFVGLYNQMALGVSLGFERVTEGRVHNLMTDPGSLLKLRAEARVMKVVPLRSYSSQLVHHPPSLSYSIEMSPGSSKVRSSTIVRLEVLAKG